ncbi:hypothetical protein Hanom_Chr17g01566021 [Helianthus anomalus]
MGARKNLLVSYPRLTQEEVEAFCAEWGIDPKFNLVAPGLDKSTDQCPAGSMPFIVVISSFPTYGTNFLSLFLTYWSIIMCLFVSYTLKGFLWFYSFFLPEPVHKLLKLKRQSHRLTLINYTSFK